MCTGITVKSNEGNYYWGRTQEYNDEQPYSGLMIPRNMKMSIALTPYKTKYAMLGVSAFYLPTLIDGVNEKGLGGGTFYFAHYFRYAKEAHIQKAGKKPMRPEDVVAYVLANYASVEEIKERINDDIAIADTPNILGVSLPQHCVFQDSTGASIVIEPSTEGSFDVYDNPIGVFTNSPKFDWHLINLQNYVGLHNQIDAPITMGDLEIVSNGKGSGVRGIPGDYTPQSRFIRAAYLKHFAHRVSDNKAIESIFHLLNSFDISKGVVEVNGPEDIQYTQYTSAYDLKNSQMFIHTYDNRNIQTMTLDKELVESDQLHFFELQEKAMIHPMKEFQPQLPPELAPVVDQLKTQLPPDVLKYLDLL